MQIIIHVLIFQELDDEDWDYKGPEMISSNSVTFSIDEKEAHGLRIVKVFENKITHEYFTLEKIPKKVTLEENIE